MSSRVCIRPPALNDQRAFVASAKASVRLHAPWTVAPSSPQLFRHYVAHMYQPGHAALLICRRGDGQLIGVVNITHIVMGAFRSAYLGYYAFAGHEGQGLMREGLQLVVRHAFKSMKLHRLEANIQPGNARSLSLVKACGFLQEGYSPRYLKIGGRWRDHERWAILAS